MCNTGAKLCKLKFACVYVAKSIIKEGKCKVDNKKNKIFTLRMCSLSLLLFAVVFASVCDPSLALKAPFSCVEQD